MPPSRVAETTARLRKAPALGQTADPEGAGSVLTFQNRGVRPIYITGDTVWYDGVAEVARRSHVGVVLLLAVAAQTRGSFHLTMNTNGAIETAHAFQDAMIVPVHYEGRAHFTQSRGDLEQAFSTLGFGSRLRLLEVGVAASSSRNHSAVPRGSLCHLLP